VVWRRGRGRRWLTMAEDETAHNPLGDASQGPGLDDGSGVEMGSKRRMPADTAFKQQRMKAYSPTLTPVFVTMLFLVVGVPFVLMGGSLLAASKALVEVQAVYDGAAADSAKCQITSRNEAKDCTITMVAPSYMKAPVHVYYRLSNFYQNHRRYVKSTSTSQLSGRSNPVLKNCYPATSFNGTELNPCGMIANTMFNDQIMVTSGQDVSYQNIAWATDPKLYGQTPGFKSVQDNVRGATCGPNSGEVKKCSASVCQSALGAGFDGCKAYRCVAGDYYGCTTGDYYVFYYPNDDTTRYLYEAYPEMVTPMKGVTEERFMVWMRLAALPTFRKMHAIINSDLQAGEHVTFSVQANFDVSVFQGSKSLVMTTTSWFGGKNTFLGNAFMVLGTACSAIGVLFGMKMVCSTRKMGDLSYLQ